MTSPKRVLAFGKAPPTQTLVPLPSTGDGQIERRRPGVRQPIGEEHRPPPASVRAETVTASGAPPGTGGDDASVTSTGRHVT